MPTLRKQFHHQTRHLQIPMFSMAREFTASAITQLDSTKKRKRKKKNSSTFYRIRRLISTLLFSIPSKFLPSPFLPILSHFRSCRSSLVSPTNSSFRSRFGRFNLEMAKGSRGQYRSSSRKFRPTPYLLPSCRQVISEDLCLKKCPNPLDKKDWEDVTCSVCLECPHNAVLLLCSSHDKGCRPYMCGTSFRYSNCLDQYKEASTKVVSSDHGLPLNNSVDDPIIGQGNSGPVEKCEVTELACPLCRGQVKGWTVVEPARDYLNAKKRSCMQDDCSFVGTYKELRKHMRAEHPSAEPRKVDPNLEQKWRRLERERDRDDVISTIRSTMPGAMVFGDYVIEGNHHGFDSDEEDDADADAAMRNGNIELSLDRNFVNFFLLFQAFGPSGNDLSGRLGQAGRTFHHADENAGGTPVVGLHFPDEDNDNASNNNEEDDGDISLVSRLHRHGRVLLGRSGRRRRRGQANRSQR